MNKTKAIFTVAISVILFSLVLILGRETPEGLCQEAFEAEFGESSFRNFSVSSKTWNSISYDLSGYYSGGTRGSGEWSCALSNNPMEFRTGILFPSVGSPIAF